MTVAEKHNLVSQRVSLADFSSDMYETNKKFKELGPESEKNTMMMGKKCAEGHFVNLLFTKHY